MKKILITGGSEGIGLAAQAMAAEGGVITLVAARSHRSHCR